MKTFVLKGVFFKKILILCDIPTQSSNSKTCARSRAREKENFHFNLKTRNKNGIAFLAITIMVVSGKRMNKDKERDIQSERPSF